MGICLKRRDAFRRLERLGAQSHARSRFFKFRKQRDWSFSGSHPQNLLNWNWRRRTVFSTRLNQRRKNQSRAGIRRRSPSRFIAAWKNARSAQDWCRIQRRGWTGSRGNRISDATRFSKSENQSLPARNSNCRKISRDSGFGNGKQSAQKFLRSTFFDCEFQYQRRNFGESSSRYFWTAKNWSPEKKSARFNQRVFRRRGQTNAVTRFSETVEPARRDWIWAGRQSTEKLFWGFPERDKLLINSPWTFSPRL